LSIKLFEISKIWTLAERGVYHRSTIYQPKNCLKLAQICRPKVNKHFLTRSL